MILRPHRTLLPASSLPLCFLAGLIALAGCGSPGTPQPPSLKLPSPPADLGVSRAGDTVILHWTMPRRATDQVLLTGDQRVVICRSAAAAEPCLPAGQGQYPPGVPATYVDPLPEPLRTGPPRLLTYTVLIENRRGRSAGPSNRGFAAAGAPLPTVVGLEARAEARGIALHWQLAPGLASSPAAPEVHLLRLHRSRVLAPGESPGTASADSHTGVPQPLEQTLELTEPPVSPPHGTSGSAWPLDHALDSNALLNRTYRYTVERVARLTLDGHPLELTGEPSRPATVDARDLFPPAVPAGLVAVGDPESGAIDLSWTPDTEADLSGYIVYRRVAGTGEQPARVSGAQPIVDPAWRDADARPGVRYAYSVSAVDASRNESARSPEAAESVIPAPQALAPPARP